MHHLPLRPPGRRLRHLSIALVAVVAATMSAVVAPPPAARAADDPHNIPGVPLPGPAVSGLLGGGVYDIVYRVQVPPAHVLLASMTGDPGTDFDLYLFDSSATDIYAQPPVGLVRSSTGPTSTESITYPTIGGGTFYIDLSGFSTIEGTFHLAVQVVADTTPPRVALSLDGGAPATNDANVAVMVVATDDLSGVEWMQFSTDGTTWQPPEDYLPRLTWTFVGPDGPRTLWVRVQDRAGNLSSPARAQISIDHSPPLVVSRFPAGSTVSGLQPTFAVRFSEPINAATWSNAGLIVQDPTGIVVYGTYGYVASTNTGTFTPAVPMEPGASYILTIAGVTDLAGNQVAPLGSWTVTPLLATSLALKASVRVAKVDQPVILSGQLTPSIGGPLSLERALGNGPFEPLVPLATDAAGDFTTLTPVSSNTSFRVHFAGTANAAEAVSPTIRVLVRRDVQLVDVDAATTRRVRASTRILLTAAVSPAAPPVPVTLTIYRYVAGRGYVPQASVTRTTASSGRYVFSWRPSAGSYYVRLSTLPTPLFANGVSPAYHWVVS
jgi:hypothetical protein